MWPLFDYLVRAAAPWTSHPLQQPPDKFLEPKYAGSMSIACLVSSGADSGSRFRGTSSGQSWPLPVSLGSLDWSLSRRERQGFHRKSACGGKNWLVPWEPCESRAPWSWYCDCSACRLSVSFRSDFERLSPRSCASSGAWAGPRKRLILRRPRGFPHLPRPSHPR